MFELCLTKLIESYLVTKDNQVGFKKKPSTDRYIFSVKSVIKYYNLYKSTVYSCFTSSHGVRQWGILSPVLFSIYMDDLSGLFLSHSGIRCHIHDLCINYVFYADDICLMAPCAIALQELINLCCYVMSRSTVLE